MRKPNSAAILLTTLSLLCCWHGVAAEEAAAAAATLSFGETGAQATYPGAVKSDGKSVEVDLSALPRGATVFRAVLRAERERQKGEDGYAKPVEVFPAGEGTAKLVLLPPRYSSLDATACVRQAVADGAGKIAFRIESLEGLKPGTLRLDVSAAGSAPANAVPAVTELAARHVAGQTILTWMGIDAAAHAAIADPSPRSVNQARAVQTKQRRISYRIYRHTEKIISANVAQATLLDEVDDFTGWDMDYWMSGKSGKPIGRYVVVPGAGQVAPGTGIYAHNPSTTGTAFYAVMTAVNGEEDFSKLGEGATSGAVEETVGEGEPVLQSETKDERSGATLLHYVRWEAPPRCNLPSWAFDYRVGLPANFEKPALVRLHFAPAGYNLTWADEWWTGAPDAGILVASNQIPGDWYISYHECIGTWKSWSEGVTRCYTPRRHLAFLDWVLRNYPCDPTRVLVAGGSMGGSGASMVGLRFSERFAYVYSSVGYHIATKDPSYYAPRNGSAELDIPHESGMKTFEYLDGARLLRQDPARDLPFMSFGNGRNDPYIGWGQAVAFARAMQECRQPHIFMWGRKGHDQNAYVPTLTGGGTKGTGLKDVPALRNNLSLPAFTGCSLDGNLGDGTPENGDAEGQFNLYLRWKTDDIEDAADAWGVTAYLIDAAPADECKVDVTPRRCQTFRPKAGETLRWSAAPLVGGAGKEGELTVDKYGLATVTQATVVKAGSRVSIWREAGKTNTPQQ